MLPNSFAGIKKILATLSLRIIPCKKLIPLSAVKYKGANYVYA